MESKVAMKRWQAARQVLDELVSTEVAGKRMGITRRQVTTLAEQGKIVGVRVGRAWLIYAPSLEEFTKSTRGRPTNP